MKTKLLNNKSCTLIFSLLILSYNQTTISQIDLNKIGSFALRCCKEMGFAYLTGMALTGIHELGHASTAKLFYDTPMDIRLGTNDINATPILKFGCFKLCGYHPAGGLSYYKYNPTNNLQPHPLKDAAIYTAGPVFGAVASLAAFKILQKTGSQLFLPKAAALFGLFNHTIGSAGLIGYMSKSPSHDLVRAEKSIQAYLAAK